MESCIGESVLQVAENSNYDKPLPSRRIKEALSGAFTVLGRSAQDAMFSDLEFNGITFKDEQYTLKQVQDALRKIFGHEGTNLLMQRVEKALEGTSPST